LSELLLYFRICFRIPSWRRWLDGAVRLDAECFFELLYDGYSEGFVSYLEAVRKEIE
jgi:hypothetical protein